MVKKRALIAGRKLTPIHHPDLQTQRASIHAMAMTIYLRGENKILKMWHIDNFAEQL